MAKFNFLDLTGLTLVKDKILEIINNHTSNNNIHTSTEEKNKLSEAHAHSVSAHAPTDAEKNIIVGVKKNGTDLTIDSSRKVNIDVPTKVSELENDSGFNKKITLSGTNYRKTVIALCKLSAINKTNNSYTSGRFNIIRKNGNYFPTYVDIIMCDSYSKNYIATYSILEDTVCGIADIKPCTFTYNGEVYGGLDIFLNNAAPEVIEFIGTTSFDIFSVDYYDVQNTTALVEEINNSLERETTVLSSNFLRHNKNIILDESNYKNYFTPYTHPSYTAKTSGLYKITVDETGHVSDTTVVTKDDITVLGLSAQDHVHNYLPLAGGDLSGNVNVVKEDATTTQVLLQNSLRKGGLSITGAGVIGLYDSTNSKWILSSDTSGNAAFNGNASTASSATKLSSSDGSETQPVYFKDGKPVAITHKLEASVPSDAKFTDTTYDIVTSSNSGLMSSEDKIKLDGLTTGDSVEIDLSGTCQANYRRTVIALCKLSANGSTSKTYSNGRLALIRTNGSYTPIYVDIAVCDPYDKEYTGYFSILENTTYDSTTVKPCTFTYNGVVYAGLDIFVNNAGLDVIKFIGTTNFDIFGVDYYDVQNSIVLIEDINNSLDYDTTVYLTNYFRHNGNKLLDEGNYKTYCTPENIGAAPNEHTHSSYVNQNSFGNVKIGNTTIVADSETDTLELIGSNVTITPDATNDKVTIGITKDNVTNALGYTPPTTDTKYTHPSYTPKANGFYKVTVDNAGHISEASAVTQSDVTALGIAEKNHAHSEYLPKTGGTLDGNVNIIKSDESASQILLQNSLRKGTFAISATGNIGMYDNTNSKWIFSSTPTGTTTFNGNATTSTTATRLSSSAGDLNHPVYFKDGVPVICDSNIKSKVNVTTNDKSTSTDGVTGCVLAYTGRLHMTGDSTNNPGLTFYYNNSTEKTSAIAESEAGKINVDASSVTVKSLSAIVYSAETAYGTSLNVKGKGLAFGSTSNVTQIAGSRVAINCSNTDGFTANKSLLESSDKRIKTDSEMLDNTSEKYYKYIGMWDKMTPRTYKLLTDDEKTARFNLGYYAQEVEDALYDSGLTDEDFSGIATIDEYEVYSEDIADFAIIKNFKALSYKDCQMLTTIKLKQVVNETIPDLMNQISALNDKVSMLQSELDELKGVEP